MKHREKHNKRIFVNLKKGALLGISIALGAGAGAVSISPQSAGAAAIQQHTPMYNQFQQYLKKPATLATARNYLINHIDQLTLWNATVMTLQLENAQKAHLPAFSEKVYPEKVQKAIDAAARKQSPGKGLTYTNLLNHIKDPGIRAVLAESRDKGYKIATSEGMYYPVMHYEGFKYFKSFIQRDVADYIDIMATESNRPMTSDAAIVISWDDVISRALAMESFVKKYPASNRAAAITNELSIAKSRVFYGASNTPAYDYDQTGDPSILDPKLRKAYESAVKNGAGNSKILDSIQKLLVLLDSSNDEFTPEVNQFLEQQVK